MQKPMHDIRACIVAITFLFIIEGCKPLEMYRHTEKGTDTYCVYKISLVKNTGTMHALKKGDVICVYCPEPDHCVLITKRWIKVYDISGNPNVNSIFLKTDTGISYYLETDDPAATCTSCPGANKFELLNN